MNATIIIGILALLIGLAVGALVVLYLDLRSWGQRVQTTEEEREKTEAALQASLSNVQSAEKKLVAARKEIENLTENVQERDERISQLDTEKNVLQSKLDSANEEISTFQDNLNQVNQHVNELRGEIQKLQTELQSSAAQNLLLQENVERYNTQLEEARTENQDVCQKLAIADVELTHLQKDLEEAQAWEARAQALQEEKNDLDEQLTQTQQQVNDLKAQLGGSMQQVTETQFLRKRLIKADTELKKANAQIETLQDKLTAVQGTLDYTGKGQLQLIRGIGPAYSSRLQEAGIHTLNDLAKSKPEQISDAIQLKSWQNVNPEDWIQEAKALTTKLGEEKPSAPSEED